MHQSIIKQVHRVEYMVRLPFIGKKEEKRDNSLPFVAKSTKTKRLAREQPIRSKHPLVLRAAAGIPDIFNETKDLRSNTNYNNDFEIYDKMLELDPELNGAVRAVSLTANKYTINYRDSKNARIREAIRVLVEETLDFDDILINGMRNLMVHGNDINKYVGTSRDGITELQSLPLAYVTIRDERGKTATFDKVNPIVTPVVYTVYEGETTENEVPADEILHVRTDYRSNWFLDSENRWSYGVWGASRFSSLKQPIRAKYNTINNRISLEESMTKQFITIDSRAIEHIQDPDEQRERLLYIMDSVVSTLEALRGDQIPIFPDYVQIHHTDTRNTIPDNTSFLDSVNGDIAAVLQVPRVAAGQERGSTFAATYNANVWAIYAIQRLQNVLRQSVMQMFSKHLELLRIDHQMKDLPSLTFDSIEDESPLHRMQRANMGYNGGMITLNQALDILHLPSVKDGEMRKGGETSVDTGDIPRRNSQPGRQEDSVEIDEPDGETGDEER